MANTTESNPTMNAHAAARAQWLLFALAIVWYSWFLTPLPNWNIASRVDLASSIVLDHKIDIDRYKGSTGDIACVNGRTFSDKPPGLSWMSLPVLAAYSFKFVVEPRNPWQVWLMALFSVALPAALLVVLLFRFVFSLTRDLSSSVLTSLAFAFGTLALPYSTLFISHQPASLILFGLFMLGYSVKNPAFGNLHFTFVCALFGFLSAVLFVTEYQMLPACGAVGLYFMFNICGKKLVRYARCLSTMLAGAAFPLACWFAYNNFIFHKFVEFGYHHECLADFRAGMSTGIGGFTLPSAKTAYDVFLLPGRGLFFVCPFLLFAIPGLWRMFGKSETRRESIAILFVSLLVTAMNLSVYQPLGGAAMGPRYLIPMLPFMMVAVAVFVSRVSGYFKPVLAGTALISAAMMFIGTITNPQVPRGIQAPLSQHNIPMLLDGYVRPGILSFISGAAWLQVVPPALISLIILVSIFIMVARAEKRNNKIKTAFSGTAWVFILSLTIFGAITAWSNYVEAKRNPAMSRLALGDTYFNMGLNTLSEERFRHAYSYASGSTAGGKLPGLYSLCANLYSKYPAETSMPCLERYAALHPTDEKGTLMLADVYAKTGRERERLKLLMDGSVLFPSSANVHAELSQSLFAHGMFKKAAEEAKKALSMDPANAAAQFILDEAEKRMPGRMPRK